ncbi:DUF3604 domain-containing protein [Lignipirellula cremea]|uniref:DUF3604 domain-containing protein n=1 Tax=Lignipirellula cremea TaxID=2528010 RepID=A0A518DVY2_9BACT|nr:DUF3604 domain-containing protein [Lignipirellula cremea]QDU95989.1 hypothetical protein Pla8534_38080 [Lignipirellula cremea]
MKHKLAAWLLAGLLLQGSLLQAHPGHDPDEDEPPAVFVYDKPEVEVAATLLENPLAYDASAAAVGEAVWFAWLEFVPEQGDALWVGRRQDDAWTVKQKVRQYMDGCANPNLTRDSDDRLWLSFEARVDNAWDVYAVRIDDQGKPQQEPLPVSPAKGPADTRHTVTADRQGGLWFVWQTDNQGQFDIVARRFNTRDKTWNRAFRVSGNDRGDWNPQAAIDSQGKLSVVWDGFDGESYNVYLRSFADDAWGPTLAVAAGPTFEGRAVIAIDRQDRRWVAWEEGGDNWGRPYRGILTPLINDQLGPLHRYRRLHVAIVSESGRLQQLPEPLPAPQWDAAARRKHPSGEIKHTGAFYERPRLSVDGDGRVWLAYRHFYTPWLGVEHKGHVEQGWGVYARYYGDQGWSPLQQFDIGQGDGMQRLELAPSGDGLVAAFTTGRTHRTPDKRPRGVVLARLAGDKPAAGELKLPPGAPLVEADFHPFRPPVRPTATIAGQQQQLFFGDLHRHTDLSLCRVPMDGTIEDAYRYASDVARLDFLGITDHSRDIAQGDPLSQLWWRSRKEVYRHQAGDVFLPFYAYERSHGDTADHNVISLRGDMLRPHTYPVPQFWKELDEQTITIPHQPIRRNTWEYQDDALRPLLEIFQGCRDTSIEEDAHRGLGKGFLLGFIASSDHSSTSASYACVWAPQATRPSIFDAFKARRTYGATARIELIAQAGEHWMGEEIAGGKLPPLRLKATGTDIIRSVELVVDGKVVKEFSPLKKQIEIAHDLDLAGSHFVYFHLTQVDGNEAWSSPFFLRP